MRVRINLSTASGTRWWRCRIGAVQPPPPLPSSVRTPLVCDISVFRALLLIVFRTGPFPFEEVDSMHGDNITWWATLVDIDLIDNNVRIYKSVNSKTINWESGPCKQSSENKINPFPVYPVTIHSSLSIHSTRLRIIYSHPSMADSIRESYRYNFSLRSTPLRLPYTSQGVT